MGLAALTRKGWQTDPRRQGKRNFFIAILAIVLGTITLWFIDRESILSFEHFLAMSIFLIWGIFSLLMGLWLGHIQDKGDVNK